MFAAVGATVFIGAAGIALLVMVQMVRGYWPLIVAALRDEPLPRTYPVARCASPRRHLGQSFMPQRLEPSRAAA